MRITTFTAFATVASYVAAVPTLKLTVSGPQHVTGVENLLVGVSLVNTGDETIKLLKDPRSVLSAWRTNTFVIEGAAGTPAFTGIAVKYSPQRALESGDVSEFTVLAPGQSFELEHDLAGVYNFTRSGAGEYKFSAGNTFQYVDESGKLSNIVAETQTHSLKLGGSLVSLKGHSARARSRHVRRDMSFVSCTLSQQQTIVAAANSANAYVQQSFTYFNASSLSDRYTTWFGAYDDQRYVAVATHFANIGEGATSMIYDCITCPAGEHASAFAYVHPDEYGTIYLCNAFWPAPAIGSDSQAGTLVHEQSHFTRNAGTEDYVYGADDAKALALSNPAQAIMNADNHEYFAENTPAQS